MSDNNIPTPNWNQEPQPVEPSSDISSDAPTMQAFDASSLPPTPPLPPPPPPPAASPVDYGFPPAPQPEKKKSKTWIWIVVVVVILLLCCCCAGAIGFAYNSGMFSNMMETTYIAPFLIG